jgi:hypothetical protein
MIGVFIGYSMTRNMVFRWNYITFLRDFINFFAPVITNILSLVEQAACTGSKDKLYLQCVQRFRSLIKNHQHKH